MRVFVFDLLPYGEHLDHLKVGGELPWPLAKRHFKPEVAVRTYAEHLDAWEEMDELGYDGVGFNEHHTSPYGLMNSPNLLAAAASQRHAADEDPDLRQPAADPRAAAPGRRAGHARLPLQRPARSPASRAASRASTTSTTSRWPSRAPASRRRGRSSSRAWTEEVFSYEGQFWSYRDVAIWPRPVQQPHPPGVGAGRRQQGDDRVGGAATTCRSRPGSADTRRARGHHPLLRPLSRASTGTTITPDHLVIQANVYVADSKSTGGRRRPGRTRSTSTTRCSATATSPSASLQREAGYLSSSSFDYVRPENLCRACPGRASATAGMTHGRTSSARRRTCRGERPTRSPSASSRPPTTRAPTPSSSSMNRGAMPHEHVHGPDPALRQPRCSRRSRRIRSPRALSRSARDVERRPSRAFTEPIMRGIGLAPWRARSDGIVNGSETANYEPAREPPPADMPASATATPLAFLTQ